MWLKYNLCYADGYGPDEYERITSEDPNHLLEMKDEIEREEGDGLRKPRFEVVKYLPTEERARRLADAKMTLRSLEREIEQLRAEETEVKIFEDVKLLSPEEIKARLAQFNKTNDWSVFDDVPPIQHVEVMYPHIIDADKILKDIK